MDGCVCGEEMETGCKNIDPKALANAIYYMIDVLFGQCDEESVTRLIMVFIDAVRNRTWVVDDEECLTTRTELDNLAASLFVYIATNCTSMKAGVAPS